MKKASTIIAMLLLSAACKTMTEESKIKREAERAIHEASKALLSKDDLTTVTSSNLIFSIPENHYFNKYVADVRFNPFGGYLFNMLDRVNQFVAGEAFVEKIKITGKKIGHTDSGFSGATSVATIYMLDEDKANAMSKDSASPEFLRRADSYPGYYSKYFIGSSQNQTIEIDVPVHAQNRNIYLLFEGSMVISKIEIIYKQNYKTAVKDLERKGFNYATEIRCDSTGDTGFIGDVLGTKSSTKCKIGPNKPRHIVVKKRYSNAKCSWKELITDYNVHHIVRNSYNVVYERGNYYLEVVKGCRALFGVDESSAPTPKGGTTSGGLRAPTR